MDSFYSEEQLEELGLKCYGENVKISRKASIYGADSITIGNNVRIDDFCVLSGKINIGCYVHIGAYSGLFAGEYGIELKDYSSVSIRCTILALCDDFSGEYMANPTIPDEYRKVEGGTVVLNAYSILGAGSTVLPGCSIGEGTAIGAMSLVYRDVQPWWVYLGNPCKKLKERKRDFLQYESML